MDFNFDRIISDEFEWSLVDKAIHDEVVRLKERISHLETQIEDAPPPITIVELAELVTKHDVATSCPFCSKLEWDSDGGGHHMHDDGCPFAIAYQGLAPEAEGPVNGMDEAVSAIEIAQSLNLDAAVRVVAKSGKNHDHGPNWFAEWGNFGVSATFGAGTNSASLTLQAGYQGTSAIVLYQASEYGRHIETFRAGPWVNRLLANAEMLRHDNEKKKKRSEAEETARKLVNFKEVDF